MLLCAVLGYVGAIWGCCVGLRFIPIDCDLLCIDTVYTFVNIALKKICSSCRADSMCACTSHMHLRCSGAVGELVAEHVSHRPSAGRGALAKPAENLEGGYVVYLALVLVVFVYCVCVLENADVSSFSLGLQEV